MSRNDEINDALVDTYRALREINRKSAETVASKPITPGAGVDPRKRIVPSKRLRADHRAWPVATSLKAYVRRVAVLNTATAVIAQRWLASKGCRP